MFRAFYRATNDLDSVFQHFVLEIAYEGKVMSSVSVQK